MNRSEKAQKTDDGQYVALNQTYSSLSNSEEDT